MNSEFHYPPQFRLGGRFIAGFALVIVIAFAAVMLADSEALSKQPWLFVAVAVLGSILISFGAWMAHVHSGKVMLTDSEVSIYRGRRQQSLPLDKITKISHTYKAFRTLILQGEGIKLCINKNLIDYQAFYGALRQKTAAPQENSYSTALTVKCNTGEKWSTLGIFLLIAAGLCVAF
jgi:hypothetical protein